MNEAPTENREACGRFCTCALFMHSRQLPSTPYIRLYEGDYNRPDPEALCIALFVTDHMQPFMQAIAVNGSLFF